jgi:hypothetical protein
MFNVSSPAPGPLQSACRGIIVSIKNAEATGFNVAFKIIIKKSTALMFLSTLNYIL